MDFDVSQLRLNQGRILNPETIRWCGFRCPVRRESVLRTFEEPPPHAKGGETVFPTSDGTTIPSSSTMGQVRVHVVRHLQLEWKGLIWDRVRRRCGGTAAGRSTARRRPSGLPSLWRPRLRRTRFPLQPSVFTRTWSMVLLIFIMNAIVSQLRLKEILTRPLRSSPDIESGNHPVVWLRHQTSTPSRRPSSRNVAIFLKPSSRNASVNEDRPSTVATITALANRGLTRAPVVL